MTHKTRQDGLKSRKKVLFLVTKSSWGGAQRYVFDLATGLSPEEFEPVVACGGRGDLTNRLDRAGIATRTIPSLGRDVSLRADVRSLLEIFRCVQTERPAIVHLNSSKAAALGVFAARAAGARGIVFTAHGWPFKERRPLLPRLVVYAVSWITAALSHRVITVSETDEKIAKRMPFVRRRLSRIPLGIKSPSLLSRAEASDFLGISAPHPRVATIAELTSNKGIAFAIRAAALLKRRGIETHYFIFGEGEERSRLEYLARQLDVADRIHLRGFLPNAACYLRAFDLFLLPSLKEGMPYALLEAAAAGLPAIATDAVSPELFAAFPGSRSVRAGDAEALADAIAEALAGKAGSATAANPFPLQEMLRRTADLYRSI